MGDVKKQYNVLIIDSKKYLTKSVENSPSSKRLGA